MKPGLNPIGAAAAKAVRHRYWAWSRRWNGFSSLPRWHVIASKLGMKPYQVSAFANWLDEQANEAGNTGLMRGEVSHFDADECAVALGMPAEEAARIFAAFEECGYVAYGHVADFVDRNRDREEDVESARLRKRRQRARERAQKQLAKLSRLGRVTPQRRLEIEILLRDLDDEGLGRLALDLARAELSTVPGVTCDAVTVTPEQSTPFRADAVDNSGGATRGTAAGPPTQQNVEAGGLSTEQAALWLEGEGARVVVERMGVMRPRAETLIERWRRDLDDPRALARIIAGCDDAKVNAAQFQVMVHQYLERCRIARDRGWPLPLPPVPIGGMSLSTERRHAVTAPPVDNASPAPAEIDPRKVANG